MFYRRFFLNIVAEAAYCRLYFRMIAVSAQADAAAAMRLKKAAPPPLP
jgi:hypothetical protein